MNRAMKLRCRFAVHLNARGHFRQERGHYGLCAAVSRAPEGSLQSSEIKKKAANLTSTQGTVTLQP